mmetsp:Transcript_5074/g.12451  ORF Transcript_5074/g.12451 Transcript_5074/m.12451 type:complete len:278 (-) Transcript_5074:475-1308(-)
MRIVVISRMMDGLLQNHQQPYRCRFRNLVARTHASCWLVRDKNVARNRTLGNRVHRRANTPASAKATTPSPAWRRLGLTSRWAPILRAIGRSRSSQTFISTSLRKSLFSSMTLGSSSMAPPSPHSASMLERAAMDAKAKGSFMASSLTPVFWRGSIVSEDPLSSGSTKSWGVDAMTYSGCIVSHQSRRNCRAPSRVVSYPDAARASSTTLRFPARSGSTRQADRKCEEYCFGVGLQWLASLGSKGMLVMTACLTPARSKTKLQNSSVPARPRSRTPR